jgi:hypothetical protein
MHNRRWTKSDFVAVCIAGLIAGITFLPLVAAEDRARELANRASCAANLRGLAQSMVVYAAENEDLYPYICGTSNTTYDPSVKGQESAGKTADDAITEMYKDKTFANNPGAAMWLMVLKGQVSPKGFICRSDPFAGVPAPQQHGQAYRMNFDSPKAISYSVAYMWGPKDAKGVFQPTEVWKNTSDSSLAILSDMAPYLSANAAPGEVTTRPAGNPVATTSPTDPLVLGGGDALTGMELQNSANHLFDGQNVAFADAHCEFTRRADIGQNNDNIWTQTVKGVETPIDAGTLKAPMVVKTSPFDIVMVPSRSAKGDLK